MHGWRTKTLSRRALAKGEEDLDAELREEVERQRPRTRADCVAGPRPCPFVSCRHHLYLDVTPFGSLKLNFPDKEVWELEESCALDVAEQGGATMARVGQLLSVTRSRVEQLERQALAGAAAAADDQ